MNRMPWKAVIRDPEFQKVMGTFLIAVIKYAPSVLNRYSIWKNTKRIHALEHHTKMHPVPRRKR